MPPQTPTPGAHAGAAGRHAGTGAGTGTGTGTTAGPQSGISEAPKPPSVNGNPKPCAPKNSGRLLDSRTQAERPRRYAEARTQRTGKLLPVIKGRAWHVLPGSTG